MDYIPLVFPTPYYLSCHRAGTLPSLISQFSDPMEVTTISIESRAGKKIADPGEVLEKALDSGYDGGELLVSIGACAPACAGE